MKEKKTRLNLAINPSTRKKIKQCALEEDMDIGEFVESVFFHYLEMKGHQYDKTNKD